MHIEDVATSQLSRHTAGAFRIGQDLRVHPIAHTVDGLGIDVAPVQRFGNGHADAAAIGAALRGILMAPPSELTPQFWKERSDLGKQFLKSAGVRSWREIQRTAVSCWIEADDGTVVMTPLRNGGTRGDQKGFQPFDAVPIEVLLTASDHALGVALLQALDKSE